MMDKSIQAKITINNTKKNAFCVVKCSFMSAKSKGIKRDTKNAFSNKEGGRVKEPPNHTVHLINPENEKNRRKNEK